MIELVNFGKLTSASKVGFTSNPISNTNFNFSNNENLFSQKRDEREYEVENVAYANPFSFLNDSTDTEASAFAA